MCKLTKKSKIEREALTTNNVRQVLETEYETIVRDTIVKGKTSEIYVNEVFNIPIIPPATHEVAAILRFATLYEQLS